jgi:hypothetical protein
MDLVWLIVSFLVTLLIFSYIFGDNPLFRLASYAFVGVAAGYTAVIVVEQVLLPKLAVPLLGGNLLMLVPLVLGVILLLKLFPRYSRLGTLPMAFLVGVAAAVAIGGAVFGTLIGQTQGAIQDFDFSRAPATTSPTLQAIEAVLVLVGTICTLVYFQFGARAKANQPAARPAVIETLAQIGQFFLSITLGSLFAGVFSASITALIERLDFLQKFVMTVLLPK